MEKKKTTNDKIDINDFGIKTLTNDKGEETEYMVYTFADDKESIQDRYKELTNTDPENKHSSFSLSYKNKEGQYEAEPFADRSIGFIISGNYNIKESYLKNANTKDEKKKKKEENIDCGKDEFNFLRTLQKQDEEYKEIAKDIASKYKMFQKKIEGKEDLQKIKRDIKELIDTKYKDKQIQHCLNDKNIEIALDNKRIRFDIELERKKETSLEELTEQVCNICNNIKIDKYRLRILNNELLCEKQKVQPFDIKSLFINLTDRKDNETTLKSRRNNSRNSQLQRIAENMNDIVNFQIEDFGHIQIPYRDAKDKKVNFPYLYEFIDTIKDLCDEHDIKLPENYPSSREIREKCRQDLEEKFQTLINQIFEKKKRCFFTDINNIQPKKKSKLLNKRIPSLRYSYLIKRINKLYSQIISSATTIKKTKEREEYYIQNLNSLYCIIKDNYQSIKHGYNEKIIVDRVFTVQNCLETIHKHKTNDIGFPV